MTARESAFKNVYIYINECLCKRVLFSSCIRSYFITGQHKKLLILIARCTAYKTENEAKLI